MPFLAALSPLFVAVVCSLIVYVISVILAVVFFNGRRIFILYVFFCTYLFCSVFFECVLFNPLAGRFFLHLKTTDAAVDASC